MWRSSLPRGLNVWFCALRGRWGVLRALLFRFSSLPRALCLWFRALRASPFFQAPKKEPKTLPLPWPSAALRVPSLRRCSGGRRAGPSMAPRLSRLLPLNPLRNDSTRPAINGAGGSRSQARSTADQKLAIKAAPGSRAVLKSRHVGACVALVAPFWLQMNRHIRHYIPPSNPPTAPVTPAKNPSGTTTAYANSTRRVAACGMPCRSMAIVWPQPARVLHDCVRPMGRQHRQAKAPGTFWFQAFFFAFENLIGLGGCTYEQHK